MAVGLSYRNLSKLVSSLCNSSKSAHPRSFKTTLKKTEESANMPS